MIYLFASEDPAVVLGMILLMIKPCLLVVAFIWACVGSEESKGYRRRR